MKKLLICMLSMFLSLNVFTINIIAETNEEDTVVVDDVVEILDKESNDEDEIISSNDDIEDEVVKEISEIDITDYYSIDSTGFTYEDSVYYRAWSEGNESHPTLLIDNTSAALDDVVVNDVTYELQKVESLIPETVDKIVEPGKYIIIPTIEYQVGANEPKSEAVYPINLIVERRYVVPSMSSSSFVYNGESQVPELVTIYDDGNQVTLTKDVDYTIENLRTHTSQTKIDNAIEPGKYDIDIVWSENFLKHYTFDNTTIEPIYTFTFEIEQIEVEFAGWDMVLDTETYPATLLDEYAEFVWHKEADGTISMIYNGYSPLTFFQANGELAIPNAKFVRKDGKPITEEIERGLTKDYTFAVNMLTEVTLAKTMLVGTHDVPIIFMPSSHYKISPTIISPAQYKILPKEVTVSWNNTCVGIDTIDKKPTCFINGIVGVDKYLGLKTGYVYYNYDDVNRTNPMLFPPQEEGQYIAKVECLTYYDGLIPNLNYTVSNKGDETSYVVVNKRPFNTTYIRNAAVNVGTMNKSSISGLAIQTPSAEQIEAYIASGSATANVIANALDNFKNVNIYIVASDVSETRKQEMVLPSNKYILVDLKMYACVDGDTNRYEITDTGSFNVGVDITLDAEQAKVININDDYNMYVARYHDGNKKSDNNQLVIPFASGEGENLTYTFTMYTNKFSEYCFYTTERPSIDIDDILDHLVPNTGD